MKKLKKIPAFKSDNEERDFWSSNSSTDFIDWQKAEHVNFPSLKSTCKSISLRLPEALISDLKVIAHKKDIPYQSLMKIMLSEKINEEYTH